MVMLLFGNYGGNGLDGHLIDAAQRCNLIFEVPQDNSLNRDGCRSDGALTKQRRDETKCEAPNSTEPKTATSLTPATLQFCPENCAVALFVCFEFQQLCNHFWSSEACDKNLRRIDIDRTILTGMVDFKDAANEVRGGRCKRGHFNEAQR